MRGWALLALAAIPGLASAQEYQAFRSALKAAQDAGAVPLPIQRSPTDLTGFPGLPSRQGTLPEPSASEDKDALKVLRTDTFDRDGDNVSLTGGIEALYQGYHIFADSAKGNLATEVFNFTGNVRIIGEGAAIQGMTIMVEFKTHFFVATNADIDIHPKLAKGMLLDDAYVKSSQSQGTDREVLSLDSTATTCNYESPHYEIVAGRSDIRPYKRAIFHDLDLIVLHHKVLHLPFISIPLNQPNYNYIPQFGHNQQEGYWMRSRYGVPLKDDVDQFDARVDYFTMLGAGLGGDYRYGRQLQNTLGIYELTGGPRSFELQGHHHESIKHLDVLLDNSYENHNYLIDPNSTTLSSRGILTYAAKGSSTRLTYNLVNSQSVGFDSQSQTVGFSDDRSLGSSFHSSFQANWSSYDTSFSSSPSITRQQLDLNTAFKEDITKATAELDYQRSIPIGQTSNFYNASDRTPVLSLKSDAQRLFGRRFNAILPFQAELSTGQYVDPIQSGHIERTNLNITFNRPAATGKHRSTFDVNGRFQQGFYSDNTAQFILGLNTRYSYALGPDTAWNLQYNYLRPQGYSPLAMDRSGRTDLVTTDLTFHPIRKVLLGAQTGYDFAQVLNGYEPWQSLGIRAEYTPTKSISIRNLATYDTSLRTWTNIRSDIGVQRGRTFLAVGLRYDGIQKKLGNLNAYVRALHWGRLTADMNIDWNGYLKRFDAQQYAVVYDLHCAEAVFQVTDTGYGWQSGRTVMFFLRLKAIPFNSLFGTGQRGQPLGTGTGRDF